MIRNPKGFGSVDKITSKKLRKPWRARVTLKPQFVNGVAKQHTKTIGYFTSRTEAMQALAEYNKNPYLIDAKKIRFCDVYDAWSERYFPKISEDNASAYNGVYKICSAIENIPFAELNIDAIQYVFDNSGKNYPTLKKLRSLFRNMYRYALERDIVQKDYSQYIDLSSFGNPNAQDRKPLPEDLIQRLWTLKDVNDDAVITLMYIFTGCRKDELLKLQKSCVHIDGQYFDIKESKTDAGIRVVPIPDHILPFFRKYLELNPEVPELLTFNGKAIPYTSLYNYHWKPLMSGLGVKHTLHDCRHTYITLHKKNKTPDDILRRLVGHQGKSVTEIVYTHYGIADMLPYCNQITDAVLRIEK